MCVFPFDSRNNGYAISTPSEEQYRGDGIGEFLHLLFRDYFNDVKSKSRFLGA